MINKIIKSTLKCGIAMSILLTAVDIIEVNATEESGDLETEITETLENTLNEYADTIDNTNSPSKSTNSIENFEKSDEINRLPNTNMAMQNSRDSIDGITKRTQITSIALKENNKGQIYVKNGENYQLQLVDQEGNSVDATLLNFVANKTDGNITVDEKGLVSAVKESTKPNNNGGIGT